METQSFLGTGWSFPPTFDHITGTVLMVSDEEDIQQSLQIILGTRPGERVMYPEFGCNLDIMLFEPLTTTLITEVRDIIETAITYYEPRIELIQVDIDTNNAFEGLVLIELDYLIRAYNSRYNLVYPYYLEEGADVNFPLFESPKQLVNNF
jgi:hypothetical protein